MQASLRKIHRICAATACALLTFPAANAEESLLSGETLREQASQRINNLSTAELVEALEQRPHSVLIDGTAKQMDLARRTHIDQHTVRRSSSGLTVC